MGEAPAGNAPSDLGPEWWVLDNALRLGRRLGDKKGREVLLLREVKIRYPGFPQGAVLAHEVPDFLVRQAGGRVLGIELTECLRGEGGRKKGSPHRRRWAAEERVGRRAEDLYHGGPEGNPRGAPPVHVQLGWSPAPEKPEKLPGGVEAVAAALAELVRETEPEWQTGERFQMGPDRLAGTPLAGVLSTIGVRREAHPARGGRAAAWTASRSYPVEAASEADVRAAVRAKDAAYARCGEACDEAWLVVALVGGGASFQTFDEEILQRSFPSPFDGVLLLCTEGGPGFQSVFALRGSVAR